MPTKQIRFFGQPAVVSCDGRCDKAWGLNGRPRVQLSDDEDDFAWKSDGELGDAPADPETYEGGHGKPSAVPLSDPERMNKWCVRECERHIVTSPSEEVRLRDFSKRVLNRHPV